MTPRSTVVLAFLWGWAEATWFFIIPDVWLTFTVFWGARVAVASVLAALAGALAGAVTYALLPTGGHAWLFALWQSSPGFAPGMFDVIRGHLEAGACGLVIGPWSGLPYRFYLREATALHLPMGSLLFWTVCARLPRLVIFPLLAGGMNGMLDAQARLLKLDPKPMKRWLIVLLLVAWGLIYYGYWFDFVPRTYGASTS